MKAIVFHRPGGIRVDNVPESKMETCAGILEAISRSFVSLFIIGCRTFGRIVSGRFCWRLRGATRTWVKHERA
jgi:hypothetical protein